MRNPERFLARSNVRDIRTPQKYPEAVPTLSIAVLLRCEDQEFQQAQAEAARKAGEQTGATIELFFADNSAFSQIQQVLSLVKRPTDQRPTAIVIELVGGAEGYMSTARAALSAGIAWIEVSGLASSVPTLRSEFPERLVLAVTTPEQDIGRIHATQCRKILKEGGGILYIEGPSLQPEVKARRLGLEAGLLSSRIKIEKTLCGDWTDDSAERAMATFLDRPHDFMPALVCAQNDEMALGIRRIATLRDPTWALIPYIGCDGLITGGQKFVREGLLTATVIKPVTTGVAVTLVASGLSGSARSHDITIAPESLPTIEQLAEAHGTSMRPSRRSVRSLG